MNVLLVEDNEFQGQLLKEYLACDTVRVTLALSGEDALIILKDTVFDLIVSDVNLPRMDGFQLVKRIKEKYKTPFFMYSSRLADSDEIQLALLAGADKYIEKTSVPGIYQEIVKHIRDGKN